jgi:hypothetical protein
MRFWLKAIADFFGNLGSLFVAIEQDDLEGSLGTSLPPVAPAPPAGPKILPGVQPFVVFERQKGVYVTNDGRDRIRKAFQRYADEHIK